MEEESILAQDILNILYNYSEIRELMIDEYSHFKNQHIDVMRLKLDENDVKKILDHNITEYLFTENGKFTLSFYSLDEPSLKEVLIELKAEIILCIKEKSLQDIDILFSQHGKLLQDILRTCLNRHEVFLGITHPNCT